MIIPKLLDKVRSLFMSVIEELKAVQKNIRRIKKKKCNSNHKFGSFIIPKRAVST